MFVIFTYRRFVSALFVLKYTIGIIICQLYFVVQVVAKPLVPGILDKNSNAY